LAGCPLTYFSTPQARWKPQPIGQAGKNTQAGKGDQLGVGVLVGRLLTRSLFLAQLPLWVNATDLEPGSLPPWVNATTTSLGSLPPTTPQGLLSQALMATSVAIFLNPAYRSYAFAKIVTTSQKLRCRKNLYLHFHKKATRRSLGEADRHRL